MNIQPFLFKICRWDIHDAIAVCRHLSHETGIPTYNGEFSDRYREAHFVMTGVDCEEGAESLLDCGFMESQHNSQEFFVQQIVDEGQDFGCNNGIRPDIAGVICGNKSQIEMLKNIKTEGRIENIIATMQTKEKVQEMTKSGKRDNHIIRRGMVSVCVC